MTLKRVLKNYPYQNAPLAKTPLAIHEDDPGWAVAYQNWIQGRNPTADPAWKEGVYMGLTT